MRPRKKLPPVVLAVGLSSAFLALTLLALVLCLIFLPKQDAAGTDDPSRQEDPARTESVSPAEGALRSEEVSPTGSPAPTEEPSPVESPDETEEPSPAGAGEDAPEDDPAGPPEGQDAPEDPGEEPPPPAPELLIELLAEADRDLEGLEAGQLIVVRSSGNEAQVYAFARDEDGLWSQDMEEMRGHTGRAGVTANKAEGDKATPAGLYGLTQAFGVQPDPGSKLPYRQATADSYWVDDPNSAYYNQWVEGTANKDWKSAEHLTDYAEAYAYAVAVDYNTPSPVPGKGSAIFLHCGSRPTSGCVSVSRADMLALLLWLDPAKDPAILIF